MGSSRMTPKKEHFAQNYVELGNASKAYRHSYNAKNMKSETIHKRASELLANGVVAGRIKELQARHRQSHDITIETLTLELKQACKVAKDNKQASAMVQALMGIAKLHGLIVDKQEVTKKNEPSDMTDKELEAIAKGKPLLN